MGLPQHWPPIPSTKFSPFIHSPPPLTFSPRTKNTRRLPKFLFLPSFDFATTQSYKKPSYIVHRFFFLFFSFWPAFKPVQKRVENANLPSRGKTLSLAYFQKFTIVPKPRSFHGLWTAAAEYNVISARVKPRFRPKPGGISHDSRGTIGAFLSTDFHPWMERGRGEAQGGTFRASTSRYHPITLSLLFLHIVERMYLDNSSFLIFVISGI